jgi:hypothetical protein
MRSVEDIHRVFRLREAGRTPTDIACATGVSLSEVRRWLDTDELDLVGARGRSTDCDGPFGCSRRRELADQPYAYLLGQYLGDGHIVHNHRGVYRLEIACCATYPDIVEECATAIQGVLPSNKVGRRRHPGVMLVGCYSRHLPCLFPQHGSGPNHHRDIRLETWQEKIVLGDHPKLFLRGLLHSDGCRSINTVRGATGAQYQYPRYQFSNRSHDIRQLFCTACDRLDIGWRQMNAHTISVATRSGVARLDEFVGPKS